MYSKKTSYMQSTNKRIVQKEIFSNLKKRKLSKVIGLGGPNITNYLLLLNSFNVEQAEIYEYDISKLALQLKNYKPVIKSEVLFGDVFYAQPNQSDTFYDLDFCCSIKNARTHVQKFTKNVCYTLSLRPIGFEQTIKEFAKLIDGTKKPLLTFIESNDGFKSYRLKTDSKKFMCYVYKDTTPMLTISSL